MLIQFLLFALLASAYSQLGLDPAEQSTCKSPCQEGECCARLFRFQNSRKRDLPQFFHACRPYKQAGTRCLRDPRDENGCGCAPQLTCGEDPSEPATLRDLIGVCQ